MDDLAEGPQMIWPPRTVWRLRLIPGFRNDLDVELTADTTAPMVLRAIEDAAERAGITLERLEVTGAVGGR